MTKRVKVYKSEVDIWRIAIAYGVILISALPLLSFKEKSYAIVIILIILLLCTRMFYFLSYGLRYIIDYDRVMLIIKVGFFTYGAYDITGIHIIKKTNTILSSPAGSMGRIELRVKKYTGMYLSPKYRK